MDTLVDLSLLLFSRNEDIQLFISKAPLYILHDHRGFRTPNVTSRIKAHAAVLVALD
jgi:hypothetical protein